MPNISDNLENDDKKNALLIENAMNKLASLSRFSSKRFEVEIKNRSNETLPSWADKFIEINDFHASRNIVIGVKKNNHTEIIKITPIALK